MSEENRPDQEVIPPELSQEGAETAANYYLAQVSNYTDRPDLLIAEIEKHDPGFIKRMNEASERDALEQRAERFAFGKFQAYTSLAVAVGAALALLAILGLAVWKGQGFWTIVGLGLFYAITQGGTQGFSRLIEGVRDLLSGRQKKDHADDEPGEKR